MKPIEGMAPMQGSGANRARRHRVVIYDPSGRGGVCQYTYHLAQELVGQGAEVTVLAPHGYELMHLPRRFKLRLIFKPSRIKSFFRRHGPESSESSRALERPTVPVSEPRRERGGLRRRIMKGIRAFRLQSELGWIGAGLLLRRPDVFHVQWLSAPRAELRLLRVLKWLGIPIIHTAHNILPHGNSSAEVRALFGRVYRLVDCIIVHTAENGRELRQSFDGVSATMPVIPHGSVDVSTLPEVSREAGQEELAIPAGRRVILFLGLIRRYKGLEYLIEAFEEVRTRVEGATLVIAGSVATDDPEGPFYQRLLADLAGRDDMRIFPEFIAFERLPLFFAAADVVALPYIKTYQSGVLLWAYAAGRPVVATDTGGLRESVDEGKSGYVVPTKDVGALARALVKVLEPPQNALAMGVYAKSLADTRYSWASIAARTSDLYHDISVPGRRPMVVLGTERAGSGDQRTGAGP